MNIRGHHLVCIPRFKGGGYSKKFRENLFEIQKRVRENPSIKIKIIKNCDEVCRFCPFTKKNKCAKKPGLDYWIRVQDNKVIKKLGIKENEKWEAKTIFGLSIEKIKNKELKQICRSCEFLKFCLKHGLNKSFVNDLKKNSVNSIFNPSIKLRAGPSSIRLRRNYPEGVASRPYGAGKALKENQ